MAPLKVIGAGASRSGTTSLRAALNILGYKTHNMDDMITENSNPKLFIEAYNHPEKPVDWSELYGDFDAGVECPTFCFVDRLVEHFPDAKVILTKREADDWYRSVLNTLCKVGIQINDDEKKEHVLLNHKMFKTIWLDGLLMDEKTIFEQPEVAKARYKAHNKRVIETVPADRLLTLDLQDEITWDKLCNFLDKPVPSEPFPFLLTTKDFEQKIPSLLEIMKKTKEGKDNYSNSASK
ncbi:P-loop containing nucleoside triphosphate hydrolase protein [Phascolomyces articulosus]|uniref:P-loop containing nucleoside triphosphate hydrolase protein n=1 Tax=Phascolomyces articulosus TaxID=60185 RepID=A0AAD5KPG8_9FUNG|nr:P-loop containing nucleoside triphosphate hydrolase protein [Phascolomyces articulosus]